MRDHADDFGAFLQRLRQRRISGDAGRIEIANRLASMTLDELRRVPPWVIVRLGPRGLALLAERSRVVRLKSGGSPRAVAQPRPPIVAPQPKHSWFATLRRRRPLWWECTTEMTTAIAVGLVVLWAFPLAVRGVRTLSAPSSEYGECGQLDGLTGNCVYVVGWSGLSLTMVSERLAVPVATLATANPSLDPNRPLVRGTLILVPRRSGINMR